MKKIQKQNIGNAGEYYIASLLSAEDFVVTITLGRAEKYDILALNPKGKTIKISVKTGLLEKVNGFPLSEKDESGSADDFYYAFVKLNEFKKEPDFWFIPSKIVNKILKRSDKLYLKIPGKKGQKRVGTRLRYLPLEIKGSRRPLYPKNWPSELKTYYKNINQLKK